MAEAEAKSAGGGCRRRDVRVREGEAFEVGRDQEPG
jgi:hypothetical protein